MKSVSQLSTIVNVTFVALALICIGTIIGLVIYTTHLTSVGNSRIATIDGVAQVHYSISPLNPNVVTVTETETGISISTISTNIICNTTDYLSPLCFPPDLFSTLALQISTLNDTVITLESTVTMQGIEIASLQSTINNLQVAITNAQNSVVQLMLAEKTSTSDMLLGNGTAVYNTWGGDPRPTVQTGAGVVTIYGRTVTLIATGTNTSFMFARLYPTAKPWVFNSTTTYAWAYVDFSSYYTVQSALYWGSVGKLSPAESIPYFGISPTSQVTAFEVANGRLILLLTPLVNAVTYTFSVVQTIDLTISLV